MLAKNDCNNSNFRPIFVIGMPRSGTTVISEVISAHEDLGWFSNFFSGLPFFPEISIINRLLAIPKIGVYLRGKRQQDSRHNSFIRQFFPHPSEAFRVWERCCGNKFLFNYLVNQAASESEKQRTISVVYKVLRFHGKKRFFGKLTGPPRIVYLNSIFPNAYFVHVIRDPRAIVSSLLRVSFWGKGGGFDHPWWQNGLPKQSIEQWISSGKSPVALSALQWKRVVKLAWEESKKIADGRFIEVRYEDFVCNPRKTLHNIFLALNLPESIYVKHYLNSIAFVKDMNFGYRRYLKPDDIRLIEKITHDIASDAGYIF